MGRFVTFKKKKQVQTVLEASYPLPHLRCKTGGKGIHINCFLSDCVLASPESELWSRARLNHTFFSVRVIKPSQLRLRSP